METIGISLTIMTSQHTSLASKFLGGCEAVDQLLARHWRWGGRKRGRGCRRIAQVVLLHEINNPKSAMEHRVKTCLVLVPPNVAHSHILTARGSTEKQR